MGNYSGFYKLIYIFAKDSNRGILPKDPCLINIE